MDLDEVIAKAKKASENQCVNDRCRENFSQVAAWLEELKQYREENQAAIKGLETNLDHYLHEILKNCMPNLAVVRGGLNMIKIEKEKPAKRELKLFSVEVALTPDVEDHMQMEANIQGHKSEMKALLETLDVNPEEYRSISKHAADAMLRDFVQQVVNLSESLEGAEMEEMED